MNILSLTLQILFSRATFEGLGNIFNNLHFTNLPFDTLLKRQNIFAKRITEAFFIYAFIEVGQRFNIEVTIPKTLDEAILANKTELHEAFRTNWTRKHLCDTPGCGKILVMDGGMKPHRKGLFRYVLIIFSGPPPSHPLSSKSINY